MKSKLFSGVVAILFAVVLSSCGKYPQVQIDAANAAIATADSVGAQMYAPEKYQALKDSMTAVMQVVEVQKAKLFHNYKAAELSLANIVTMSTEAQAAVEARKAQLIEEIATLTAQATATLAEVKELIKKAPRGKEGKAMIELINSEIAVVEAEIPAVEPLKASGQLIPANDKIKAANDKVNSIKAEIETAIAGSKKK